MNTEVSKLQRNLTALVEFSRLVNSSLELEFILNNLLLSCFGKFLTTKGLIALSKNGILNVSSSKGFSSTSINDFPNNIELDNYHLSEDLKKFCSKNKLIYCEKIISSRKTLGIILLGEKINKINYTEDEIDFLKTILNIAVTAIENSLFIDELKFVNRTLDSRVNRLSSLFELSKEFGLLLDESRISKVLIYSLLGHFMISNYAVSVIDNNKIKILESTCSKQNLAEALNFYNLKEIKSNYLKEEIEKKLPELKKFNFEIIIPMHLQNETKGILFLGKRINKIDYTESDIEFVESLGSLAIISLENKRLFKEALEKQRLEEELEIAKDIQKNLLPKEIPALSNFDIAAVSISSKQVGGDYYDLIRLDEKNLCISVADVSGKSVPAALLMANLQAFLKSICRQGIDISDATGIINDLVTENTSDGRFITFFWGILNNDELIFNYVNAGHNPPIIIKKKNKIYLDKGGMLLGVLKTFMPYKNETINLESGDLIVLFTDGVTEAKNLNDDEFTDEKFENILLNSTELSAQEILNKIRTEISNFANGQMQSDDITLVVIKVK